MKRYLLTLLSAIAIFTISCKSSKNDPTPAGSNNYLPLTPGSSWSYKDDGGSATDNVTITMTGAAEIFYRKAYYTAQNVSDKSGSSTVYFYAHNHNYSTLGLYIDANTLTELQMGDDNKAVGYSWTTVPTFDGFVGGMSVKTVNTMKEKNITKTVNGKTFTNVIHTQVDFQFNSESNVIYDIYLAKDVGIIQWDTRIYETLVRSRTITGYTIK
jgi:hypothetical protein